MTILSTMLAPQRSQKKAASNARGSIFGPNRTMPLLGEEYYSKDRPKTLLVTNMRGAFVLSTCSSEGVGRYGFSEIDIDDEDALVTSLYEKGISFSKKEQWDNIADSIPNGLALLGSFGLEPRFIVASETDWSPQDVSSTLDAYKSAFDNPALVMRLAALPKGGAIITSVPALTGVYARTGEYVGVHIPNPQRVMVFVES